MKNSLIRDLSIFLLVVLPILSGYAQQEKIDPSVLKSLQIEHYNFSKKDKDAHIRSAMYIASNNKIYIGSGLNMPAPVKFTKDFPVSYEGIEKQVRKDLKAHYGSYPGGHFFKYDPQTGDKRRYTNEDPTPLEDLSGEAGFRELGPFAVDRSPYYSKRAYQFDALAVGPDGTILCGESDRDGKLFFYIPGEDEFRGTLNPTNPVIQRQRKDTPGLIQEAL